MAIGRGSARGRGGRRGRPAGTTAKVMAARRYDTITQLSVQDRTDISYLIIREIKIGLEKLIPSFALLNITSYFKSICNYT